MGSKNNNTDICPKNCSAGCWCIFIFAVIWALIILYSYHSFLGSFSGGGVPPPALGGTFPPGQCVVCDVGAGALSGPHCCQIKHVGSVAPPLATKQYAGLVVAPPPPLGLMASNKATVCDHTSGMPCSLIEKVIPHAPDVRANVPSDFFLPSFTSEQIICNDIQIADHCQRTGKYAYLRSPQQRFEDYPLEGVYGGKYCKAQCEPEFKPNGERHCRCVCTISPNPVK